LVYMFDDVIGVIKHAQHALIEEKDVFKPPDSWPNPTNAPQTFQNYAVEAAAVPAHLQPRPFVGALWSMMKGELTAAAKL
jgi:hypothetical protein